MRPPLQSHVSVPQFKLLNLVTSSRCAQLIFALCALQNKQQIHASHCDSKLASPILFSTGNDPLDSYSLSLTAWQCGVLPWSVLEAWRVDVGLVEGPVWRVDDLGCLGAQC